jgi:Tfp pilus assembly protein PilE
VAEAAVTVRLSHLLILAAIAALAVGVLVGALAFPRTTTRTVVATVTVKAPVSVSGAAAAAAVAAGFIDEAHRRRAQAEVRAAIPSIEAYYSDHNSYTGATISELRTYDSGIGRDVRLGWVKAQTYCITATADTSDGQVSYRAIRGAAARDSGEVVRGSC